MIVANSPVQSSGRHERDAENGFNGPRLAEPQVAQVGTMKQSIVWRHTDFENTGSETV